MTWVRLDDAFPEHPKVDRLSDAAFRLHVAALAHCSRLLTDGYVGQERVSRLVPRYRPTQVVELTDAGLWEPADCGWQIHDYLLYQPTAEKVKADRAAAVERMRRRRSPERSGEQPANVRPKFADPVPDPVPVLLTSSSSHQGVRGEAGEVDVVDLAARLHAVRSLAARGLDGIGDPAAWKATAAKRWLAENGDQARCVLLEHPDLDATGLLRRTEHGSSLPGYRIAAPVALHPVTDEERQETEDARAEARRVVRREERGIPTNRETKEATG